MCPRKTKSRRPFTAERKALQPQRTAGDPRSCIRNQSREIALRRPKIALALPSYDRQRLSSIRRGWCPSRSVRMVWVIRADVKEAHRLSLSARVLSAGHVQVKAKAQQVERERRRWKLDIKQQQSGAIDDVTRTLGQPCGRIWVGGVRSCRQTGHGRAVCAESGPPIQRMAPIRAGRRSTDDRSHSFSLCLPLRAQ